MALRIAVAVLLAGCGFHPTLTTGDDGQGSADAAVMPGEGGTVNGPCDTPGAIRDDFDDGVTAEQWNVISNGMETGGSLVVTPTTTVNPPMQFMGYLSKHSIDLTGDEVTVEVTGMVDLNSNAVGALYLSSDNKTYLSIYERNNNLVIEQGLGSGPPNTTMVAYNMAQQAWWRIAEAGGSVTFSASPDGVTWTVLSTISTPSWITRARIGLGGSTDIPHGSVSFDNLNQANAAAGWCKPGTFVDDFNRTMIGIDWDAHVTMPSGCLPAVSNGARFDQNGTPNSRCWLTTRQGFDLTGDHVMAYIPALTSRPSGWSGFLRVVSDNVNDAFLIQYDTGGQLCAQVQSKPEVCIAYASTDTYWRIGESGGTLTFDTSSDAVAWTVVAAIPVLFAVTAVDVEIGTATTNGFGTTANYVLDDYNKGP